MWLFGTWVEKYKVFGELEIFSFFFFFHSLSHSLPLCVSASLYSAVKTPQPPSHGCHSNHLPALTSYVSVRSCMWARVRVRARWGTWHIGKVSAGCLSYHLEAFPLSEAVCVTQNYTHTHTQPHTYAHTQAHTLTLERLPVYLMCCNCGSWVWLWFFQF